jgi:signal recognition particle subunit SRP68
MLTFFSHQPQKLPLSERLGQYAEPDENVVITRFPPGLEPIPCKPFFFDVALNHIPVPDVSDRAKVRALQRCTLAQ